MGEWPPCSNRQPTVIQSLRGGHHCGLRVYVVPWQVRPLGTHGCDVDVSLCVRFLSTACLVRVLAQATTCVTRCFEDHSIYNGRTAQDPHLSGCAAEWADSP
mmetsp:Transcript_20213/g.32267  ORF Transcript_20213/g.32267 Transcript_20213/m.32267 type:complete len:102 (+) Transcript_20213:347-652(+)